jgi:hypothetical protein
MGKYFGTQYLKKKKKKNHKKRLVEWLKVYTVSSSPSTTKKSLNKKAGQIHRKC